MNFEDKRKGVKTYGLDSQMKKQFYSPFDESRIRQNGKIDWLNYGFEYDEGTKSY